MRMFIPWPTHSECFSELFFSFYLLRDGGCSGPFQKIEKQIKKDQKRAEM
jgi:hypothetical protein